MRKTLSLVLALLLTIVASSQTRSLLLTESFDSDIIPEGWYIADDGTENWSISTSAKSGGTPNELCLNWAPEFYGTTRLVMPPLDLSGISSVLVSFKHYHDNYIGENLLGIATSSDNGTTWNSAWSQIYIDIQAFNENHVITTPDMNKDNVLICIYFEGNSYLFNNWFFDDIQVYEQEELDVNVISIDIPKFIPKGENEVKFTVQNLGSTNIETFDAELSFSNDDMILSQTFQTNLAPFETAQFSFGTHYFNICDPFTITVNVNSVNSTDDDDASNNILEKNINVALGSSERVVLIEENYQDTYYENPDIAYIFEDSYLHTAEVVAVYENGMTSVATPTIIDVTTGLNELNNFISCKLYPNPANDYVRITGDNIKYVSVFNCVGALIYKSEIINDNIELNTENYNSGLYLIEIQSNEGFTKTIKLVLK